MSDDGFFRTDPGDLGLDIRAVLVRKKNRLAEHVRQARVALVGFEQAHGSQHFRSRHDQHKHKALKRDVEVVEEEFAIVHMLLELNDQNI